MKKALVAVLVIIIIAGGIFALTRKSNSPATNSSTTPSSTSTAPSSSSSTPASSGDIIQTETSDSAGKYLADSSGKTLYTYGGDTSGVSNCTGSCLSSWPAYTASGSTSSLPANVGTIKRSDDGSTQYTYKGMPLYYFTGDSSAGQVTGDGLENFHVAKP